jgi:hypothetical protein
MATDDSSKIVVEVPSPSGNFTTIHPRPQLSKLEIFRQGWINQIALPDNLPDLLFDITSCVTVPALVSSAWVTLPIPMFLKTSGIIAVLIALLTLWQLSDIPELRTVLIFRLVLAFVGVMIGL